MRSLFLVLAVLLAGLVPADAASVVFKPTNADFRNPERGFWREANGDFLAASADDLDYAAEAGTIVYAPVRLDAYRGKDLPHAVLDKLNAQFALVRAKGLKVILRFAYNEGFSGAVGRDAQLKQVLRHIAQVKPVVAANKDVIFVWQMGFIGPWGEGHSSASQLDTSAAKTQIGDALLAALPKDRMLMWRTPRDLKLWYPTVPAARVAPRIGMFNDCFLSDTTDVGTFAEKAAARAAEKSYLAAMTARAPFGGETCYFDASTVGVRTSCTDILAEGKRFHLTFLGRDWYPAFYNRWKASGCLNEVSRNMGYRLQLTGAAAPGSVARGGTASLKVSLRNLGWAAPVNPRRLVLRVRDARGRLVHTLAGRDLRSLEHGHVRTEKWSWVVPRAFAKGTYSLSVAAPDSAPSLAARPAYAVRFANAGQTSATGVKQGWNARLGEFALGLRITVK